MYVKISIISLFAILLISGASAPSMVFGDPAFNVEDKYSSNSECSLPDEIITFSIDKDSYQFGDEIKISGQVIPKQSNNFADQSKFFVYVTIPKFKSTFASPLDDGTKNTESTSTYDESNASSLARTTALSTLDTSSRIDECGNFEASIKILPLIFKNGFYVLNLKYTNEEVETDFLVIDEGYQRGCFEHQSYISESGRCGDFKGDEYDIEIEPASMPEIILSLDKDNYLPGDIISISGHIANVVYNDTLELIIESTNVTDETNESVTKLFTLRGSEPIFSFKYNIPSGAVGIGTYTISAISHLDIKNVTITVDDESIVTDYAAQQSTDVKSSVLKKIIDKHNRITVSEVPISLGEKISGDKTLVPRVMQGSLFTAARGDEASVNIQISTSSGQCVIGQHSMCAVSESTRKSGSIYELVQIGDKNYNVRYSGPDVRLEKFTIIPEDSNTEIDTKNWNVSILKADQPTKFYYKVSYVLFE
tara:strand:- start:1269 stop:2705 length:1437 start_codon:yes stop_codon:yes gene_type:complete